MLARSTGMSSKGHFDELVSNTSINQKENELGNETAIQVRDRCFEYLNQCRESDYYKTLQDRARNSEELDKYELFYIVATSDDVTTIPKHVLEDAQNKWQDSSLARNIEILSLLNGIKTEQSAKKRYEQTQELQRLFDIRANDNDDECFVNLRGFDFNFLYLTDLEMSFADLSNCQLGHTFLSNTTITHCIASNLKLSLGAPAHETVADNQSLVIDSTKLNNAQLWQFHPDNKFEIAILNSDMSSANISITNKEAIRLQLVHCNLQSAALDLSELDLDSNSKENSFAECSMIGTNFSGNALLKMVDVNKAKVLNLDPESDFTTINCQLTLLHECIDSTRDSAAKNKVAQATVDEHVRAITFIASQNLIDHLQTKAPRERYELLVKIMQHPIFQPQSSWQQTINSGYQLADSFCSMFCKRNTGHAYFASPAMRQFEQAKDEAILELGKHAKLH